MAELSLKLKDGLTATDTASGKEIKHTAVVLQELQAGDILDANRDAERVVFDQKGNPLLVVSPSEAMRQMLRRHIKRIGSLEGPLDEATFNKLTGDDLKLLDKHTKTFGQITSLEVGAAGRTDKKG